MKVTNDIESKKWSFRMGYHSAAEVILIRERISANRIWARVVSIRNPHNKYTVELMGVVEFDEPYSLNWLQQNIFPLCDW
jgi:hypothetical protein